MTANAKTHWEAVYQTKPADTVSWFQAHARQSLDIILRMAGDKASRVIDVGGGASTLVDDLLAHQHMNVSVLDISSSALDVARSRLGAQAEQVQWIVGDITQVALPEQAHDIWHDRAVFHFLIEPAQRAAYVDQVRRAVRPGGHVIVAAFGPDGPTQCSGLPVMRYAPGELHAQFGGAFGLLEHLNEAHKTPGGAVQQFVYCLCVMQ